MIKFKNQQLIIYLRFFKKYSLKIEKRRKKGNSFRKIIENLNFYPITKLIKVR